MINNFILLVIIIIINIKHDVATMKTDWITYNLEYWLGTYSRYYVYLKMDQPVFELLNISSFNTAYTLCYETVRRQKGNTKKNSH